VQLMIEWSAMLRASLAACVLGCQAAPVVTRPAAAPAKPEIVQTSKPSQELGSLRHSRVALSRGNDAATLTYFARELDDAEQRELAKIAPHLHVVVGLSREQALARASEAQGADASYATSEFLRAATNLVWMQAQGVGVDRYLKVPELAETDRIVLTNMRGASGPAIADHAFAMLLALTRDLPVHLAARAKGEWNRDGSGVLAPIVLQDRTMLVVGLGGIGSEIARRAHGFGMHVIATRRGARDDENCACSNDECRRDEIPWPRDALEQLVLARTQARLESQYPARLSTTL